MSIPKPLLSVTGDWSGRYKLYFTPEAPIVDCETNATVEKLGDGRFLGIRYDWSYEGKPQEGFMLVGADEKAGVLAVHWIDSFHNGHRVMVQSGKVPAEDAEVSALGSYAAPPGPDWGWRTLLEHSSDDELRVLMYNIEPDQPEQVAVEAVYRRR